MGMAGAECTRVGGAARGSGGGRSCACLVRQRHQAIATNLCVCVHGRARYKQALACTVPTMPVVLTWMSVYMCISDVCVFVPVPVCVCLCVAGVYACRRGAHTRCGAAGTVVSRPLLMLRRRPCVLDGQDQPDGCIPHAMTPSMYVCVCMCVCVGWVSVSLRVRS
jgi:hypothetical protein